MKYAQKRYTPCQVAVEGGWHGAERVLHELKLVVEVLVVGDGDAHHDIGMTVDVLRNGMNDDIRAELERVLEVRTQEGVVDDEHGAVVVNTLGDGADVDEAESGVGRGFNPDELCVGLKVALDVIRIVHIYKVRADAELTGHLGEVAVGTAVHVVHGDHVRVRTERLHNTRCCRRAGAEGKAVLALLERSDGLLEDLTGGIARAGVVEALV
ncbi:hypothetical protein BC936DRAFT_146634 [Jimgerdemannia flammicorona]|uniref:Uncharacterized protein n=1 Tax=Jimgerdemannia flammicorona TaxID=994334 RepID=A0A433DLE1_9FUNG|nr:hypothetical protein BC936DRAFT_146634 [Jimgerdemannia flammicorona]